MTPTSAMATSRPLVSTFRVLSVSSVTPGFPGLEAKMQTSESSYAPASEPRHSAAPVSSVTVVSDSATALGLGYKKLFVSHQPSCAEAAVGAAALHDLPPQYQLTKEFSTTGESIEYLIELRSLLMQLKIEQVCQDFLAGQIIGADRLDMVLRSLDMIGTLLFPEWTVTIEKRQRLRRQAATHFQSLCSRSLFLLKLPGKCGTVDEFPYTTWREILENILSSQYWSRLQIPDDGVSGRLSDCKRGTKCNFSESMSSNLSSDNESDMGKNCTATTKLSERKQRKPQRKPQRAAGKCSEKFSGHPDSNIFYTRSLSSGLSEQRCGQSSSCSRAKVTHSTIKDLDVQDSSTDDWSDSDSDVMECESRPWYPREAVDPGCFDLRGTESLKHFLSRYERYFNCQFVASPRDCNRVLSRFINGELKDAYDALGGARLKYSRMKEGLLEWYHSRIDSSSSKYKSEFEQTHMRSGESFLLYFMRLEGLALRAFCKHPHTCVKQLREKVINTVPEWFVEFIEWKEEIKIMSNLGRRVTWRELLELAEMQDKKLRKRQLCTFEIKTAEQHEQDSSEQRDCGGEVTLVGVRRCCRTIKNSNYKRKVKLLQCYSCGNFSHVQASCVHSVGDVRVKQ